MTDASKEDYKKIELDAASDPESAVTSPEEVKKLDVNPPHLSYLNLFAKFLSFGSRAFGGPMAQIAMMKEELVDDEKWISIDRWNRVYSLYQVVPGPEAFELACYFGHICRSVFGAFLGGLGFALPGCLLELLASWLYVTYGFSDLRVCASFRCIQIVVSAFIFRAAYKLSEAALNDHKTKAFMWDRGFLCLWNFLTSVIGLNFFASLGISGVMNTLFVNKEKFKWGPYLAYLIAALTIVAFFLYVSYEGVPSKSIIGDTSSTGAGADTSYGSLFILGFIAGCVSFGGAYTTLPFIYAIAVDQGKYLTNQQFLDALAICNMLPTPLVSFVATVGFIGNGIGGAVLMLVGIFLPAFIFPIVGHEFLQAIVVNSFVEPFLDGVAAAVIGLLLQVAFQFLKGVMVTGLDAVVFFLAFTVLFQFTNKFTQPIMILVAAITGQIIYL